jgi:hypothetical protein
MRDWSVQRIWSDMIVAYIREGQHLVAQGHEAAANDKFCIAFEVLVRHYQQTFTDPYGRLYTTVELAQALFPDSTVLGSSHSLAPRTSSASAPTAVVLPLTFAPHTATILPQYYEDLTRLGSLITLPRYADQRIRIDGHDDSLEGRHLARHWPRSGPKTSSIIWSSTLLLFRSACSCRDMGRTSPGRPAQPPRAGSKTDELRWYPWGRHHLQIDVHCLCSSRRLHCGTIMYQRTLVRWLHGINGGEDVSS